MLLINRPARLNQLTKENLRSQESLEKKCKLDLYVKLREEGCCANTALKAINISKSTYYRWRKKYKEKGIVGLEEQDKTPHEKRTPTWTRETELLIAAVRNKFPLWGKAKIKVILAREHGVERSESMVGRILVRLINRNIVKPVSHYNFRLRQKKKRNFSSHAKRWKYGMKSSCPGELIQVDHATISLDSGYSFKHFSAVCPVTKCIVEQAYTSASSHIAEKFLNVMIEKFPFGIKSIQVDGGSEFMGDFERGCEERDVPLFVLPPRRPQYNGVVERSHGTVKSEFYDQYFGSNNITKLREKLQEYTIFYNTFRPHQRLNYQTPMAYYSQLGAQFLP